MPLSITGDAEADALLDQSPFALLVGMLLDQQIAMETAFTGPAKLRDRLGALDPAGIAALEPEKLVEVMKQTPSVHRFPGSMAGRLQSLASAIVSDWGGDTAAIWTQGHPDGAEVLRRLKALPGFGEQKAKIFLALLGKRKGLDVPGWREAAGDYGLEGYRSVADIVDADSLARVREHKRAVKAAARS